MSEIKLAAAREFIVERNYRVARAILESLPHNPTAIEWLSKLNNIEFPQSDIGKRQLNNPNPIRPLASPPPMPIQYEYKTVKIVYTLNHDQAMNNKIKELAAQGWEFLNYTDEGRNNIFGMRITDARILSFRRPINRVYFE